MRFLWLLAVQAVVVVTPALSQPYDFFETREDAARRLQAEQYSADKDRARHGNSLMPDQPRDLGEAPPSRFSSPRGRSDEHDPTLPANARPIR
jgi:hypothetical protein